MSRATAILVRTHTFDPYVKALVMRLSAGDGYDVYVLADHRSWEFPVDGALCISLTWEKLASLGLPTDVDTDVLWQCGDYGLYIARQELPHIQTFWLYEYDVHHTDPIRLLTHIDEISDADFLSTNFRGARDGYVWAPPLTRIYEKIFECTYSILRISALAVDNIFAARQALCKRREAGEFDWCAAAGFLAWPNDEALTATVLKDSGFECRDFNDVLPDLYDLTTFRGDLIFHSSEFIALTTDHRLYHSVRSGRLYLSGVLSRVSAMTDEEAAKAKKIIDRRIGGEWTEEEAGPVLAALTARLGLAFQAASPNDPWLSAPTLLSGTIVTAAIENKTTRFFVTRPDDPIQRLHLRGEFYDRVELDLIRKHVMPQAIIVDVGASIGNHTIYFSKFTDAATVYPIEPDQVAIDILRVNIALNQCSNVDLSMLGTPLSDSARFVEAVEPGRLDAGGTAYRHVGGGVLKTTTGDHLFGDKIVNFIKVDVESMELFVLEGFSATIRKCRPLIFVDVVDNLEEPFRRWRESQKYEIVDALRSDPYHCGYLLTYGEDIIPQL